jgi:hypothetical protein
MTYHGIDNRSLQSLALQEFHNVLYWKCKIPVMSLQEFCIFIEYMYLSIRKAWREYMSELRLLNDMEILFDQKASKELIQDKYKKLKEWFKLEYKKVQTYKHDDGYICQWYHPLITDIFVTSLDLAKTNSAPEKIKTAIYDASSYYMYWNGHLESYEKECK